MAGVASGRVAVQLPDRKCGECSLCCKLLPIEDFNKPAGEWCKHCAPGKGGCTIYETRPETCQRFMCLWLFSKDLDGQWKPSTSKIVMYLEQSGRRIAIYVEPSVPNRWREEPYYSRIKSMSEFAIKRQAQVVVYINNRAIVVLPNKDVDLGNVRPKDRIYVRQLPSGMDWEAWMVPFEDIPPDDRDKRVG